MQKHGDGALVIGAAGVFVNGGVQRGNSGEDLQGCEDGKEKRGKVPPRCQTHFKEPGRWHGAKSSANRLSMQ
jgi:hypothetical protein